MRLKNEIEETTKTITVEDYTTFKNLLKSPWLFYLLIAYTVYIVINAVLSIIDGGYFMGVLNLVVQGVICAGLWIFRVDNKKTENEKFSTKGIKMFQIAHAVKYVILFVLLVILLVMIVFAWIGAGNEAHQLVVSTKNSLEAGVHENAVHASRVVFWKYFGLFIGYLVFMVGTCVYYKAVMCFVEGVEKYHSKGLHCWNDLKFLAIYLFVSAGILVIMNILMLTGVVDKLLGLVSNVNYNAIIGGVGILSCIGRFLFAAICVVFGIVCLKGYKVLSTTQTSHEEIIDIE